MSLPPELVGSDIQRLAQDAVSWRHDLHRQPELLFDVASTADYVAQKLMAFGCDAVLQNVGRSGVVGLIRGRTDTSHRVIGLRAELDALPIEETAAVDYRSTIPGRMHACGHDGHMAMLLGAACHLATHRDFDGTVAVLFQPAEEGGAGAREMLNDGLADRFGIDLVFGLHNLPGLDVGCFGTRVGAVMASSDRFDVAVTGRGGHAAMPDIAVDPVLTVCQTVTALQSVVSRNTVPGDPLVISVTGLGGSDAYNVIPDVATFRGTVRAFRSQTRDLAERRLIEIVNGVAATMGASATVSYRRGYPATVNHEEPTVRALAAAAAVVGLERVEGDLAPQTASEDFAFMLEAIPGSFLFIGNGNSAPLHSPDYIFNDDIVPTGIAYWLRLVSDLLTPQSSPSVPAPS